MSARPAGGESVCGDGRYPSAGFAGAIRIWGEVRKGGGAPLRVSRYGAKQPKGSSA
jgi:hypothetical protein